MPQINRRELLRTAGAGAAALALAPWNSLLAQAAAKGPYTLPELPYKFDALEPYIDAKTMEIHHDRHHAGYVANLNAAIASDPDLGKMPIDALMRNIDKVPEKIKQAVINNGGGHANHSLFWEIMATAKDKGGKGGGEPMGPLAKAIEADLGGFTKFKKDMSTAGVTRFGSGWAWLVVGKDGKLAVFSTANQDSPLMKGQTPILGLDVWEHAYYLKYQNFRPKYVEAWWNVVNWPMVAERFDKAKK
jgi:Fe-Mn family superoxide dismutase